MKIQIFLASSVDEFKYDRLTVGDFINRLNKLYHKDMDDPKYDSVQDLFFVLEKCEDEDNSIVAQGEIQDRIDSKIVGSDFVFLLFGKTIKKWTKHEFRYACGILKKTGKPKIVVYMRTATDEGELITQDEEAEKFKSRLMSKNYIGKYAHIDTLLFNIVMYIIAMDIDSVKINVSNEILKDGDTEILSLKNVPAWSANDALLQAQEELNKLEERYLKLKTEWLKKGHREEVNIEYKTVAAEYEKKREETQMLRIRVFDDLCLASKAILSGGLTERQSRAYQLMEEGKWKEANILLNFNDIKNDCQNLIELKKKNDELKSVAIETGKQIKTQAQGFLDELLLKIRLSTSFARNSTDFDKIHEFYIEAIRHSQHFDLPQEVLFLYAQFLKEQHKDTKALKYAMDYCNCKSVSDLTKQAAALMFTVNLLNQNEKKYELSQKYWQKAIAIWSRIFDEHKKTDLQNDKDLLCEFHNFILESADYILSNKFFHGEEEFIGPVMTRFRSLHDLCTAVRKRYDIAIKFPECIPDSYVKMIANRIFHSEPKEAPTSWDEVRKERDSFLHYEAITPFNQGEELLVYAYIIMNKLKEEMPSDKDVLRYFAKSNCYLSSLIINADPIVSRQMLSLSVDIYEKLALSNDSPQTKLDIALVYTNLGQTFLSEDLKNHNKTNEKKVVKLHNKAITLYEELYRDNPDIYYLNLIMAYSLKAEHIRKYRYDDKRDISVDEVKAINKLLEISNTMSKSGVEFPINITRTIVNDVRRFIWLMLPFNFNHVEIVELNYKYAIAICEKYKKKYPKAFSLELFNTYFDYFKFLSYNKSEFTFALSFLKKAISLAVEMVKTDNKHQFIVWDNLHNELFSVEAKQYAKENNAPKISGLQDLEEYALTELVSCITEREISQVFLLPHNERYERYEYWQWKESDNEFIRSFQTLLFRATMQLSENYKNSGKTREQINLLRTVFTKYLKLLDGGSRYSRLTSTDNIKSIKSKRNEKSDPILREYNTVSMRICHKEFLDIRKALLAIDSGAIVVSSECYAFLSLFEKEYMQENQEGWDLTEDYAKLIDDKCLCLVHTIGEEIAERESEEGERLFADSFSLQKRLAVLSPMYFEKTLCYYHKYDMYKWMRVSHLSDKQSDKIRAFIAMKDFYTICKRHKVYDEIISQLKSFKLLQEDEAQDEIKINDAIDELLMRLDFMIKNEE